MRVVLVQLPVPNNRRANLPLALGYLKASAEAAKLPGLEVELLDATAQNLGGEAYLAGAILARDPDLVGISLYTWNASRSLQLARALKERAPELILLGGGPEINHDGNFTLSSPDLDYVVQGEGELAFLELLRLLTSGYNKITPENFRYAVHTHLPPASPNSLNFVGGKAAGRPVGPTVLSGPALEDVNLAPSAYLTGALEGHLGRFMSVELSRWCPSKCTFCYYGRQDVLRGGKRYFDLERVRQELLYGMERGIEQIHFVEANFNTLPHLPRLYEMLKESGANRHMSFYAEMRGEAITLEQAKLLAETNFNIVEVGLQSAVPEVLARVQRKNNLPRLAQGIHNLRDQGIEVFVDLILGLPGETPATFQRSVEWIEQNGLGPFDLFHLQVLPGTQLKAEVEAGQHGIKWQPAPPYFVLETADLAFEQLAELRRKALLARQDDPAEVAGLPQPGPYALVEPAGEYLLLSNSGPVERVILDYTKGHIPYFSGEPGKIKVGKVDAGEYNAANTATWDGPDLRKLSRNLASQVTIWLKLGGANDAAYPAALGAAKAALATLSAPNPGGLWHLFVESDRPLTRPEKASLTGAINHEAGYLDRLAVFARDEPGFQVFERWPSINFYEVLPLETAQAVVRSQAEGKVAGREIIARISLAEAGSGEDWQREMGRAAAFEGAGMAVDSGSNCSPARFKTLIRNLQRTAGQLWLSDLTLAAGQAFSAAEDLAGAEESLVYPLTAVVTGNEITYHAPGQARLQQAALSYRLAEGRKTAGVR
jgi:radical SAM superfamily enzyme YgiQ (UPF0313 family)